MVISMHGDADTQVLTHEQGFGEDDDRLVDIPTTQLRLGRVSRGHVNNLLKRGEILGTKLGSRRMIFQSSIDELLKRKREKALADAAGVAA